jgi:hypothetical protein
MASSTYNPSSDLLAMISRGIDLSDSEFCSTSTSITFTWVSVSTLLCYDEAWNLVSAGSPKGISLLGSNFSTSPGSGIQGQVPSGNGQLGSIGLTSDGGANDGLAFDISEFPQLGTRQSSSGGLQGPVGVFFGLPFHKQLFCGECREIRIIGKGIQVFVYKILL